MTIGRSWRLIARACVVLAVLSLVFNISLPPEMAGHWELYSCIRKSITKVLSSGTAWAGIAVYAGWRVARPRASFLAGVLAAEATLLIHYLLGWAIGIYGSNILSSNVYWFVGGLILCGPLGVVGWLASRTGRLAVAARLVVPLGALTEPFVTHRFSHPFPEIPWPERYSDTVSGVILMALGLFGIIGIVLRGGHLSGPDTLKESRRWARRER